MPLVALTMGVALTSCEEYNDYTTDYDYSAVYFGTQQPLRTVVSRADDSDMTFKLGVVLAGIRDNQIEREVLIGIDESLMESVSGASALTILPEDCYTTGLDNNRFTIPVGSYIGDFDINIDKAKFAELEGSLGTTYALPYRIVDAQADSILRGDATTAAKDYTIVVVKYINEYSGYYYSRYVETNKGTNEVTTVEPYDDTDCTVKYATTTGLNQVTMSLAGIGASTDGYVVLDITDAGAVSISSSNAAVEITDLGTSSYDLENDVLTLKYEYTYGGVTYSIVEDLQQRQDPEDDLRFEEW